MAAVITRRVVTLCRDSKLNIRHFHPARRKFTSVKPILFVGIPCSCILGWQWWEKFRKSANLLPVVDAAQEGGEEAGRARYQTTYREVRFRQFASVEYEGNIYMTPQDFLESVTEETPRPRIGRTKLTRATVENMLRETPPRHRGSPNLFRSMHDKGIISYTEYLFLLCVLTNHDLPAARKSARYELKIRTGLQRDYNPEPQSGFRIAFNMFDTDGNQIVDKREFLVLETFFTLPSHERKFVPREQKHLQALLDLESVFSKEKDTPVARKVKESGSDSVDPIPDTTLLIHFFGPKGRDVLKYDDFHRFMENLQSEVIQLEFHEFSKGMLTISEEEFARILLRYTSLDSSQVDECIERVRERIPQEKGITFEEFKEFCQFLNSLDDFTIAMKMYTYAEHPVSKEDFQRAVMVCTGNKLGEHLVNTVFQIFDADGDGHLSHKEFISIMKDRMHRGAKAHLMHHHGGWETFKSCVKHEMRSY